MSLLTTPISFLLIAPLLSTYSINTESLPCSRNYSKSWEHSSINKQANKKPRVEMDWGVRGTVMSKDQERPPDGAEAPLLPLSLSKVLSSLHKRAEAPFPDTIRPSYPSTWKYPMTS